MQCNVSLPTNPPYLVLYLSTVLLIVPSSLYQPYRFFVRPSSSFRRLFPLFSTLLPTLCSTLKDAIVEAITSKRRKLPGTCDYLPRFPYLPSVALFLMNSAMNLPPRRKNSRVKKGEMLYEYERLARRRFDASNEY